MMVLQGLVRLRDLLGITRGQLNRAIILVLLTAGSTAIGPMVIGWVIDVAMHPQEFHRLMVLMIGVMTVEAVRLTATFFEQRYLAAIGAAALASLRKRLVQQLLGQPLATIQQHPTGALVTRVTNDVATLSALFTSEFVHVTERLLIVVGVIVSLFITDVQLALVSLALIGIFLLIAFRVSPVLAQWSRASREEVARLNGYLGELIDGARSIRSFGVAPWCLNQAMLIADRYRAAEYNAAKAFAVLHPSVTVINGLGIACLLFLGGQRVAAGTLTIGALTTFIAAFVWFFWPILHVLSQWQTFVVGMVAVDRLGGLLSWPVEPRWEIEGPAEPLAVGSLSVADVSFEYNPGVPVLRGISFSVKRGEFLGIVGPSGAGKSTIVNVLAGLVTPGRGQILCDQQSISELPLRSLRRTIGVVDQEAVLFGRSLGENLLFGGYSEEKYHAARAYLAGVTPALAERLLELEGREFGERGILLSAGERQLVSLARAVIANPPVLILDEATCTFDPALEGVLLDLIRGWGKERIVIAIAHRLRLVEPASEILVLKAGKIVERGTHGQLLAAGGLYALMSKLDQAA